VSKVRQERKVRSLNSGMILRVVSKTLVLQWGQLKSTGSNCAMLDRMKKPELLITQKVGEVPVRGVCSACPHIVFDIGSKRAKRGDHERKLKELFSEHLKKVHAA
jgi:hypothetical protein